MKLNGNAPKSIDLDKGETELDSMFDRDVESFLRYGLPAFDKAGHWAEIRVRVRPLQLDMIAGIKEKMPEGWYKSQASLYRALIAVGCKTAFEYLKEKDTKWHEVLLGLNEVAREQRLREFKHEMKVMKARTANSDDEPAEKVKTIDLISKLEQKVVEMW